jgi:quinol monooxygenase YgiN
MIIVAGHLVIAGRQRDRYLAGCKEVVEQARRAAGCLEFSITADLLDPDRVVIFERWESRPPVEAFREGGPSDEQMAAISSASVTEYDVTGERRIT